MDVNSDWSQEPLAVRARKGQLIYEGEFNRADKAVWQFPFCDACAYPASSAFYEECLKIKRHFPVFKGKSLFTVVSPLGFVAQSYFTLPCVLSSSLHPPVRETLSSLCECQDAPGNEGPGLKIGLLWFSARCTC